MEEGCKERHKGCKAQMKKYTKKEDIKKERYKGLKKDMNYERKKEKKK